MSTYEYSAEATLRRRRCDLAVVCGVNMSLGSLGSECQMNPSGSTSHDLFQDVFIGKPTGCHHTAHGFKVLDVPGRCRRCFKLMLLMIPSGKLTELWKMSHL